VKKRKISPFDLVLLLLVIALGIGVYSIVHTPAPTPPSTPEELLGDITRLAVRSTDQEELKKIEHYNIVYSVYLEDINPDYLQNIPSAGAALYETYSSTPVGTLEEVRQETVDGHTNVTLDIAIYAVFSKTTVTSPSTYPIRVGTVIPLETEDGRYLGSGTITWISH
jgi:hypothetical protein